MSNMIIREATVEDAAANKTDTASKTDTAKTEHKG